MPVIATIPNSFFDKITGQSTGGTNSNVSNGGYVVGQQYSQYGTPSVFKDPNDSMVKEWTTDRTRGDTGNFTYKDGQILFPVWKSQSENVSDTLSDDKTNTTPGGFTGVDYSYFTDLLKKQMSEGDPNLPLYKQNLAGTITKAGNTASDNLKESLAQSGMLRSGANIAGQAQIESGKANALANADVELAKEDTAYRGNALAKLLGLQQLGLSELNSQRSYNLSSQELAAQLANWEKMFNYNKDNQPSDWGKIFAQILNSGSQVGSAAIAASDRRLKENIKRVATSKSGIPVYEFNYIGRPEKYKGVMADEVEEAVININGVKFVDYSKIDVDFEAL